MDKWTKGHYDPIEIHVLQRSNLLLSKFTGKQSHLFGSNCQQIQLFRKRDEKIG